MVLSKKHKNKPAELAEETVQPYGRKVILSQVWLTYSLFTKME